MKIRNSQSNTNKNQLKLHKFKILLRKNSLNCLKRQVLTTVLNQNINKVWINQKKISVVYKEVTQPTLVPNPTSLETVMWLSNHSRKAITKRIIKRI